IAESPGAISRAAGAGGACASDLRTISEQGTLLEPEEILLQVQSTAKADEAAIGADDTMTGNHDRDRVLTVGRAHGANGRRPADPGPPLAVAPRFPVRVFRRAHARRRRAVRAATWL